MTLRTSSRLVVSSAKFVMRAQAAHALRLSASEASTGLRSGRSPQTWFLRWRPAGSSRGALGHSGSGLSACSSWLHSRRLPSRLTTRSSRRRFVASLKLAVTRAILAPVCRARRGLTQALGGQKHSLVVLPATVIHWLRSVVLFGHVLGTLSLRQALNARSGATCVALIGFGNTGRLTVGTFAPDAVASVTAG